MFFRVECTNQLQDVPIKLTKFNKFTKFNDTPKIERRVPEVMNRGQPDQAPSKYSFRMDWPAKTDQSS